MLRTKLFSLIILCLFVYPLSAAEENVDSSIVAKEIAPKKVAIFYTSYGAGHISAAKAIEQRIKLRDAGVEVKLIDLSTYYPSQFRAALDKKLYWLIVKNFPNVFSKLYNNFSTNGRRALSLEDLPEYYDKEKIASDLKEYKPDVVVTTHYGSAETVAQIRKDPALKDIPVGWLHTDYVTSYFPRISKAVDMSFLPHPELEKIWKAEGVDPSKFATTGMPLNPKLFEPTDRNAHLTSQGLSPDVKTITLASGAEGVGDFPLIVKKLAESVKGPLQIIAVCANNKKHEVNLAKMQASLPEGVKLIVKGYTPQEELLKDIKSSDLYITKGGGLSPTEGFAINVPMVILDVYGGHETENAVLFEKLNLAAINRDQSKIGEDVNRVLADPVFREKMLEAQQQFKNSLNADRIVDFVFDPKKQKGTVPKDFGTEGGGRATKTHAALAQLEHDSPADVELITSYASHTDNSKIKGHTNPFGHTAIRIGDKIYTANHLAQKGEDHELMHTSSLEEYLYGVDNFTKNAEHGSSFGMAYTRSNLGLRIKGLKPEQLEAMHKEAEKVNEEYRSGKLKWHLSEANCADLSLRILKAGGVDFDPERKYTLPADVLQKAFATTDANPNLGTELIGYVMHPESQNKFSHERFPLSLYSLGQMTRYFREKKDPVLDRVTKVISAYPGSTDVHYENVDRTSIGDAHISLKVAQSRANAEYERLKQEEKSLHQSYNTLVTNGFSAEQVQSRLREALKVFTPQEIELLTKYKTGPPPNIDLEKLDQWNALQAGLKESVEAQELLQTQYDEFNQGKIDFLMESNFAKAKFLKDEMQHRLTDKQFEKVNNLYEQVEANYNDYLANKHLYGQPKDIKRLSASRTFFDNLRKMHDEIGKVAEPKTISSKLKATMASLGDFFTNSRLVVKNIPGVADYLGNLFIRPKSAEGKTPLTGAFNRAFTGLRKSYGIDLEVTGHENLPQGRDPKTINLITPIHANPMLDNMALAGLGIPDMVGFGASDQFAPEFIANQMDKVDHYVTVGRGSDKPIEKMDKIINEKGLRNFLIFPEGGVPAGMYETRPLRDKFSWGLVKKLKEEGYKVNIIPITFPDNFQLHNGWITGGPEYPKKLRAIIHKPIDDAMVGTVLASGNDLSLNHLIRQTWLDTLQEDEGKVVGMKPLDLLQEELDEHLHKNLPADCRNTLAKTAANNP